MLALLLKKYGKENLMNFMKILRPGLKTSIKKIVEGSEEFKSFKEGKEEYFTKYRIVRKDGSIRWILDKAFWIKDDQGKIEQLAGIAEDITERKFSEEKLSESELRYKELYNNITTCVAIYDAMDGGNDFVFKDINKAGEKNSKVRIEEIKGKSVLDIFPSVKDIGLFDIFKNVYKTGKPEYLPTTLYKDERISQWVENYVYKLPSGEIVAVYEDIIERKKGEEELKYSEKRYRLLFESVQAGVILQSVDGKIIHANKTASEIFRLPKEDILEKTSMDPIWNMVLEDGTPVKGEDHPSMITIRTGKPMKNEIRGIYSNDPKKIRWLIINTCPIFDEERNSFQEVLITFDDITEMKKSQEKIRESEEKYSRIVNTANEGIWIVDDHYATTFVNSKMADMLGYNVKEMIGKSAGIFLYDNSIDRQVNRMAARAEGLSQNYELALKKKNGEKLWALVSATSILDDKDNFKGFFAMFTDINERKQNEETIKQLNDNLKLLNKILRHDISNDLTVVSIALETIETKDEDMKNKAFNAIQRSVDLIEKIRCLESSMSAKYDLKPLSTSQATDFLKENYSNITINITGECKIIADDAFTSVIDNIVNNAITHGKTDKIDIEISSEKNICQIMIIDHGKGIPDEIKKRIFDEEFSYGENRGTGLGLYLVKKNIERYGGTIGVKDTKPHGATFIIKLSKCIC